MLSLFNVMLDRKQLELICQTIPETQVQILQLEWNFSENQDASKPKADDRVSLPDTAESEPAAAEDSGKREDDEGHSAVYAQLLGTNSPLVFLSLRSNGITSAGAVEIANALKGNTMLQSLNLFQNRIGDDGALAIAHAVAQSATLKSISVASNGLSGKGWEREIVLGEL